MGFQGPLVSSGWHSVGPASASQASSNLTLPYVPLHRHAPRLGRTQARGIVRHCESDSEGLTWSIQAWLGRGRDAALCTASPEPALDRGGEHLACYEPLPRRGPCPAPAAALSLGLPSLVTEHAALRGSLVVHLLARPWPVQASNAVPVMPALLQVASVPQDTQSCCCSVHCLHKSSRRRAEAPEQLPQHVAQPPAPPPEPE